MGSLSVGDRGPLLLPRLSFRQPLGAVARVVFAGRMVRTHHFALAATPVCRAGLRVPAICDSLQPDRRRRRGHTPAPRPETTFLQHLSECRGQRSLLGAAVRGLQSAGLLRVASRSPRRLWRISRLGHRAPAVFLRRLRRRLRICRRQFDPPPQYESRDHYSELFLHYRRRHAHNAGRDRASLLPGTMSAGMRAYSASSEEALRARNLLKDWFGERLLTEAQYQRMEQETVCDLRRTNIFLRLVLFLFTLIIVGAAVALFFEVFLSHPGVEATGILLLIFAAISYAAAEFAVSQARLYRYGIEEALAVCSVGFLCAGMQFAFFENRASSLPHVMEFLVPAAGAIASLWIWRRFGF